MLRGKRRIVATTAFFSFFMTLDFVSCSDGGDSSSVNTYTDVGGGYSRDANFHG